MDKSCSIGYTPPSFACVGMAAMIFYHSINIKTIVYSVIFNNLSSKLLSLYFKNIRIILSMNPL